LQTIISAPFTGNAFIILLDTEYTGLQSFPISAAHTSMPADARKEKVVIVGAGPVGALAALYAARAGDDVEVYELRGGA